MGKPRVPKIKPTIDDPAPYKVLDDILNHGDPVIPEYADLPRRWREAPSDPSQRGRPGELTKDELVTQYVWLGFSQPLAREGLRRLSSKLTTSSQPIPEALRWWNRCISIHGDPPTAPGPRHKIDRDVRVVLAFRFLGDYGLTREDAIALIAGMITKPRKVSEDTIRSIILKYRTPLRTLVTS